MFECRACVWRCIRAITNDTVPLQVLSRRPLLLTRRSRQQQQRPGFRRHASTAIATKLPRERLVQGKQPIEAVKEEGSADKDEKSVATANDRHLKLELRYLQDKVKLAEHVHYTLRCDKPDKALELCRLASKKQDAVVSWNHCVNWHIQRGKVDEAIKIYNEMKKRAQFPDSYTYSLLLRGLALPERRGEVVKESNVAKALSIYYSMSSPTSRVRPGILHTNNVLKVCSAALDMEALWGVVAKLPEHGADAPDHITYAILLDAIRHGAFGKDEMNVLVEGMSANRIKAVQEGRAIWRDVIKKWRGGQIHIDERLVSSMARLLLMSNQIQDWDDVLNLVQQTTQIPRQLPALDSPERHIEHIQGHQRRMGEPEPEEDSDGYSDTPTTKAFLPVQPYSKDSVHLGRPSDLGYLQPGTTTLNILLEACSQLQSPKAAGAYWDLLTGPNSSYRIRPEHGNYHTFLRLLGRSRSSARAVALLCNMPNANITPNVTTVRIAMSICVRDKNNPHVLDHARAVVDVMEASLADPDVNTLIKYLNLALLSDNGPKIAFAVNRLDSIIHNLRSRVTFGADTEHISREQNILEIEEILYFFQAIVGVIDTLNRRGLVPAEDHPHWQGRRAQLDSFIGRATTNVRRARARLEEERGQKIPRARELDPKKGMKMGAEVYALRKFRWQERKEREEREKMLDARRLLNWKFEGRKTRAERVEEWEARKGWNDHGGKVDELAFADSAMDLGMK